MEEVYVPGQRPPGSQPGQIPPGSTRPGIPGTIKPKKGPGGRRPEPKGKNIPEKSPGPFKEKGPLDPKPREEVIVRGKDLSRATIWRLFQLGFRGLLGGMQAPWTQQLTEQQVLELLGESPETGPGLNEAITDQIRQDLENYDALEAVVEAAPTQETAKMDTQIEYYESTPLEEITVYAPRISNSGTAIREIEYGWDFIRENPISPGHWINQRPWKTPDRQIETPPRFDKRPVGNPYKDADLGQFYDPYPGLKPRTAQNIQGSIDLKITPRGLRLRSRVKPRLAKRRREENTRRKDSKETGASAKYRRILRFVNKTFGEATEMADMWDAIAWNVTVNGKPLASYADPVQALQYAAESGNWEADFEQMATDIAFQELMDSIIGKTARTGRNALNEMNYYGPNPGSYVPDP
jgi:hypothetical protein